MKRGLLAMLVSASCAGAAAAAAPPAEPFRLCVLDQTLLVQHSRLAQATGERFQQIRRQAQEKIEDDRRTLEADVRALDSLRSSIPPAIAQTRDAEIAKRRADLNDRIEQANRTLAALDKELTKNVLEAAADAIRAVEAERGCSMSIARSDILSLHDSSLDITPYVIARTNAGTSLPAVPKIRR